MSCDISMDWFLKRSHVPRTLNTWASFQPKPVPMIQPLSTNLKIQQQKNHQRHCRATTAMPKRCVRQCYCFCFTSEIRKKHFSGLIHTRDRERKNIYIYNLHRKNMLFYLNEQNNLFRKCMFFSCGWGLRLVTVMFLTCSPIAILFLSFLKIRTRICLRNQSWPFSCRILDEVTFSFDCESSLLPTRPDWRQGRKPLVRPVELFLSLSLYFMLKCIFQLCGPKHQPNIKNCSTMFENFLIPEELT